MQCSRTVPSHVLFSKYQTERERDVDELKGERQEEKVMSFYSVCVASVPLHPSLSLPLDFLISQMGWTDNPIGWQFRKLLT